MRPRSRRAIGSNAGCRQNPAAASRCRQWRAGRAPSHSSLQPGEPDAGWDYAGGKKCAVEAWQRRFLGAAFREVGGSLQHPNGVTVTRVAELTGLTPKGVRDVLRDLGVWPIE